MGAPSTSSTSHPPSPCPLTQDQQASKSLCPSAAGNSSNIPPWSSSSPSSRSTPQSAAPTPLSYPDDGAPPSPSRQPWYLSTACLLRSQRAPPSTSMGAAPSTSRQQAPSLGASSPRRLQVAAAPPPSPTPVAILLLPMVEAHGATSLLRSSNGKAGSRSSSSSDTKVSARQDVIQPRSWRVMLNSTASPLHGANSFRHRTSPLLRPSHHWRLRTRIRDQRVRDREDKNETTPELESDQLYFRFWR